MVCNTGHDYLLINHVHVGSTIIAHAGDGNFHVIILFDPTNEKEVKEATDLSAGMVHLALEKEGMMGWLTAWHSSSIPLLFSFFLLRQKANKPMPGMTWKQSRNTDVEGRQDHSSMSSRHIKQQHSWESSCRTLGWGIIVPTVNHWNPWQAMRTLFSRPHKLNMVWMRELQGISLLELVCS